MTSGEADGDSTTTQDLLPSCCYCPKPTSNLSTVRAGFMFLKVQCFPPDLGHEARSYQHAGHLGTRQELQQGREQVQGEQSGAEERLVR